MHRSKIASEPKYHPVKSEVKIQILQTLTLGKVWVYGSLHRP